MKTLAEAERYGRRRLAILGESAAADARLLLAEALGKPVSHILSWPNKPLDTPSWQRFRDLIMRRRIGEPVAYLTGRVEFWSLPLCIRPPVLVPRPDSELLVETALELIPPEAAWRIADLGTGSGALALALASERPHCSLTATDRSPAALNLARHNARRLGLENIRFVQGHWFAALGGQRFHMLVSNPPYVAADDPHLRGIGVRCEARSALIGGPTGMDDLQHLCARAPDFLRSGGWLLLEHGFDQAAAVRALLESAGLGRVRSHRDLHGQWRLSLAQA